MKLTLELTTDKHERPIVLATLAGGWPTAEECRIRKNEYFHGTEPLSSEGPSYFGGNPRTIAGSAAADLLGGGGYRAPVDEIPNDDGALVFVGGPTTR